MTPIRPTPRIGAILLAAGSGNRFGSSKQLALLNGIPLVRHATNAALDAGLELSVVLGANAEAVKAAVNSEATADRPIHFIVNETWADGMGSSIACGAQWWLHHPDQPAAVIICLADQPLVGEPQLRQLIELHSKNPQAIIAAEYGSSGDAAEKTLGPPCLFPQAHFTELAQLHGAQGARLVLQRNMATVIRLAMPEAEFDIDTVDDLSRASARF